MLTSKGAINEAGFSDQPVTDVFWPREELYREVLLKRMQPAL